MEEPDAFARATVRQVAGSRLRVIDFRGGELVYDREDQLVLSMGLTANHSLIYQTAGCRTSVIPLIGRFGLMTPGQRFHITLRGDCSVMQLVLPRVVLESWLAEDHEVDGRRLEIACGHGIDDRVISQLLLAARVGGVEGESWALRAIATRLFERFSARPRPVARARGGMSPSKLRRVIEIMEDDPARAITVEHLAREVFLSPYHFAHQFQRATGRAPHRFMLERKLSRAVGLLSNGRLSIAHIAAACGFSHGSHLSRQLHRVLGQSPLQMRRALVN